MLEPLLAKLHHGQLPLQLVLFLFNNTELRDTARPLHGVLHGVDDNKNRALVWLSYY